MSHTPLPGHTCPVSFPGQTCPVSFPGHTCLVSFPDYCHTYAQFESPLVHTSQLPTEAVSSMMLVHSAGSRDVQHPTQECFDDHIFHTHHQAWRKRRNLLSQTKNKYSDQRQMTNRSIRAYLQCPFLPPGGISTWRSYSTCSRSPPPQGRHICMQPSM